MILYMTTKCSVPLCDHKKEFDLDVLECIRLQWPFVCQGLCGTVLDFWFSLWCYFQLWVLLPSMHMPRRLGKDKRWLVVNIIVLLLFLPVISGFHLIAFQWMKIGIFFEWNLVLWGGDKMQLCKIATIILVTQFDILCWIGDSIC